MNDNITGFNLIKPVEDDSLGENDNSEENGNLGEAGGKNPNPLAEYLGLIVADNNNEGNILTLLTNMRDKALERKNMAEDEVEEALHHARDVDLADAQNNYNQALDAVKTASDDEFAAALQNYLEKAKACLADCPYSKKDELLRYYEFYKGYIDKNIGRMRYDNPIFTQVQEMIGEEKDSIRELYGLRLEQYIKMQGNESELVYKDFERQKQQIADMMNTLHRRGNEAFAQAEEDLKEAREAWLAEFQEKYESKAAAWNDAYTQFADDMKAWVDRAEQEAVNVGSQNILASLGSPEKAGEVEALVSGITKVSVEKPEASQLLDDILSQSTKAMLDFGRFQLTKIENINTDVGSMLPGKSIASVGDDIRITQFQLRDKEDLKEHSAKVTAQMALNSLEEAIADMEEQIDEANERVAMNMDYTLGRAGYSRKGSAYKRQVVVDSSLLGGDEYKTQSIVAYKYYDAPEFDTGVDLRPQNVMNMSAEGINCLVAIGMRNLTKQMKEVFGEGKDEEEATDEPKNLGGVPVDVQGNVLAFAAGNTGGMDEDDSKELDGLFTKWVGDAPELIKKPDPNKSISKNIETPGIGEIGRMMTAFYDQEFKRQIGEARAGAPFFAKPLFGGKLLGFSAPSLRDIAGIAVSIAQGGVGSLVGAAVGDVFSLAKGGIDISKGVGGVIAKTALTGMEMVTQNLTVGAVNAFEYRDGKFGFNANRYKEGLIGTSALASYAGGMAGTFTQGMLDMAFLGNEIKVGNQLKGYENVAGWKLGEDTKIANIQTLTSTIGNIVNAGVEFGISGHTSVNLLNFRDIAKAMQWDWFKGGRANMFTGQASDGWRSVGLFQMNIDSRRGISSQIGMGGVDLSLGNIVDSFKGIAALQLNAQIVKESNNYLGYGVDAREKAAAMRATLDFGSQEDKQLIMNSLAGVDRLFMMQNVSGDGYGKTIENVDGGRDVFLRSSGSSNIIDWISGAVTISHEAQRSGKVESDNDEETRRAVDAHLAMADNLEQYYGTGVLATKQMVFLDRMAKQKGEDTYRKYIASVYDSSEDFWTIRMEDGHMSIQYDFENNVYFEYNNENGVKEKILLFTHNQQDWEKIQQLEAAYKGAPNAQTRKELEALKAQYNKLENTGYITDKLGAMLLYGDNWENKYKTIAHSGGLGEFLVKDIENQMAKQGFNHDSGFVWNVNDKNAANMKFDITDYFLSFDFSNNDRARIENVLGNSALCDSDLFDALHKSYLEGKAISYAQALLNPGRDLTKDYSAQINASTSDVLSKIRNDFGLYDTGYYMPSGTGSDYDRRLYSYISNNQGLVEEKVQDAYLFNFKNQDKIVKEYLKTWGYDNSQNFNLKPDNPSFTSICWLYVLVESYNLNSIIYCFYRDDNYFREIYDKYYSSCMVQ